MMEADLSAHLTFLCAGALICGVFAWILQAADRDIGPVKAIGLSVTETVLGEALGLAFAKAAYYLMRINYLAALGSWKYFTTLKLEELSFFGGAAGVILAVYLSARIFRLNPRTVLNRFAPAGALLVAAARFAEYYLAELGLGLPQDIGMAEDAVVRFPFGVAFDWFGDGEYVEYYLAVFRFEGAAAAAAMVFALIRRNDRDCFIRTLFYICLAQVLLESMRMTSIAWLFVKTEQLICFLYVEAILVLYAVRKGRERQWRWLAAPIHGLIVCGIVIAVEFALDGKILADWTKDTLYICMGAALATLAVPDILYHRSVRRAAR